MSRGVADLYYTGVGARKLPKCEVPRLRHVARVLESRGWLLRSGGAYGSDAAFESGVLDSNNTEIYLPKPGYNGHPSALHTVGADALALAKRFHTHWHKLGEFGQLAAGRNCYQVLGADLQTPSTFVACWTPHARVVGGTGFTIRLALAHTIPVFNFAAAGTGQKLSTFLMHNPVAR